MAKKVAEVLYRVIMCSHLLPFLATTVIRRIVAICGNLVKQNIARNGEKVTEVLYRVADQSFYCHFWQLCAIIFCHFWQLLSYGK